MAEDDDDHEIGYGKPPRSGQFKKGQSGNPSGKKRPLSLEEQLKKALAKTVTVTIDGKKQIVTMQDAMLQSLVRKAAGGDLQAIRVVLAAKAAMGEEVIPDAAISDHQLALLKDILAAGMGGVDVE